MTTRAAAADAVDHDPSVVDALVAAVDTAAGRSGVEARPDFGLDETLGGEPVPHNTIPEYLRRVRQIAEEDESRVFAWGHAGDGNIHFAVFQRDAGRRQRPIRAFLAMGSGLGGAVSGEHGIGRAKMARFDALADSGVLALCRRVNAAFDPQGILNPGCTFDLD